MSARQVGSPESVLAPLGGKDTPKQRRRCGILKLLEVGDGDGERCSKPQMMVTAVKWKVCWRARSPSGTSPAAGSDPTRPPSPERCGCASACQHRHVCQHQLSIPPLTYCRKASAHSPRLDFPLLRPPRRSESPLECPTCPCKRTKVFI